MLLNFSSNDTLKKGFFNWLDMILKNQLPPETVAINFNLYEDGNDVWSIEMIGASEFDEDDEDWACEEVFATRANPYVISKKSDWKTIQKLFSLLIKEYFKKGKYSNVLKNYLAVGIGFVDGNVSILYKNGVKIIDDDSIY